MRVSRNAHLQTLVWHRLR